jgi:hypothetical protein
VRGGGINGFRSATPIAGDNKGAEGGVHPSCAGTVNSPAPFRTRRCDIELSGETSDLRAQGQSQLVSVGRESQQPLHLSLTDCR